MQRLAPAVEITNPAQTPVPALLLPKYRREGGLGTAALNARGARWRLPRHWQKCSAYLTGVRNRGLPVRPPSPCYPAVPTGSLRPAPAMDRPPRARRWRHALDCEDACTPRSSERRRLSRAVDRCGRVPVPPAAVWQALGGAAPRDYSCKASWNGCAPGRRANVRVCRARLMAT